MDVAAGTAVFATGGMSPVAIFDASLNSFLARTYRPRKFWDLLRAVHQEDNCHNCDHYPLQWIS